MNFLPDVYVLCDVCRGARYNRETLGVTTKRKIDRESTRYDGGRSPYRFSKTFRRSAEAADAARCGLGYIKLGNRQRPYPAERRSESAGKRTFQARYPDVRSTSCDEPTTGLHFADVHKAPGRAAAFGQRRQTVIVIDTIST